MLVGEDPIGHIQWMRYSDYPSYATQLGISERTVHHHIQHIYDKLGISTRAAATLFAMRHDLLGNH